MNDLMRSARQCRMFVILDLSAYRNSLRRQGSFAYEPAAWKPFLAFVAARYRQETALAYYALAGEDEAPQGSGPHRATASQLITFFRQASADPRAQDAHHLISTSGLLYLDWDSGIPWQELFALPAIDLAAIHIYSEGDRQKTLPAVSTLATSHARPLILEEFGFTQKQGDAARASAFAQIYDAGRTSGASGVIFWNLGPELAQSSYDVSPQTPDVWAVIRQYGQGRPEKSVGQGRPEKSVGDSRSRN